MLSSCVIQYQPRQSKFTLRLWNVNYKKKIPIFQPLLSCEVDYGSSWEPQNPRDNVWNKQPSALGPKAAKWESFKIFIFPTTSLMRNMSEIKWDKCDPCRKVMFDQGKPCTATVQVSPERFRFSASWRETPQGKRVCLPLARTTTMLLWVENKASLAPVFCLQIEEFKNWQGQQLMWAALNQMMAFSSGL